MCVIKDRFELTSINVANVLIARLNEKQMGFSLNKVQGLLYIAYGLWLKYFKARLTEENPVTGENGPVFRSVSDEFYNISVVELARIEGSYEVKEEEGKEEEAKATRENLEKLFNTVIHLFGDWSEESLSIWNRRRDTPWWKTMNEYGTNQTIPDSLTYEFFAKL